MSKVEDLSNKKYGKLNVIERIEDKIYPNGKNYIMWKCICDCQENKESPEYKVVRGIDLRSGNTKSCGCSKINHIKQLIKENKKYNTYNLDGNFGIGYTRKGEEFYFDKEDYDLIKNYCWFIKSNGNVVSHTDNHSTILFHRLILGIIDENIQVDHIKHERFDNRKSFLRVANSSYNQMNKSIQRNNTSGVPGVNWSKRDSVWIARITVCNKRIYLGRFINKKDAVNARKQAEIKYFGEWSYDNSMNYEPSEEEFLGMIGGV